MGEFWELLRKDPIVCDIEIVIKQGLYEFDISRLSVLPDLFGDDTGPADSFTIRQEMQGLLMVDDPGKSPSDPELHPQTKFNLTLFRYLSESRNKKLGGARADAGRIYRPDNPVGADGVRRRPSAQKPSGGPEWKLIERLQGQIVTKARAEKKSLPAGVALPEVDVPLESEGASLVEERQRHGDTLDQAWNLLDLCRSNAFARAENLKTLSDLAGALAQDSDLNEARALVEFAAYESNRGLEKYRLEQGIRLLEAALSLHGSEARVHSLHLLLMKELAHLAVYGGLVDGDRRKTLKRIIELGDSSLTDPQLDEAIKWQMRTAIAEALKELCFVTHDAEQQRIQYERARKECEDVVAGLEGDESEAAVRLTALAKRHQAITYELQEDKEREDEPRQECLKRWSDLCKEGAALAEQVGDDHIRAYCLLNLASTQSRRTRFIANDSTRAEALDMGKDYLDQALPLVEALEDERGRAWVYLHLCENTELRAEFEPRGSAARIELVRDIERYAIQALNHLKPLDDPLGLTVAHLQLGKALCMLHEESEADAATMIRLERAIDLLGRAVEMTQNIGYYQEYPAAARWLARSLKRRWLELEEPKPEMFVEGINALITGICECYAGQGATGELELLYNDLSGRLDRELSKRR